MITLSSKVHMKICDQSKKFKKTNSCIKAYKVRRGIFREINLVEFLELNPNISLEVDKFFCNL